MRRAATGPECVKTLSALGCLSSAALVESISQVFAPTSTSKAPERLWRALAPSGAAKPRLYAASAFSKLSVPMIFMTRFML